MPMTRMCRAPTTCTSTKALPSVLRYNTQHLAALRTHIHHIHQQHNARRAELHRLKEKHPEQYARLQARAALRDDDDEEVEESTSEEEVRTVQHAAVHTPCAQQDDGFIAEETEAQILATLKKLRSKDPEIYDPSKRFFNAQDDNEGDEGAKPAKKAKPMLLKDVLYQQVRGVVISSFGHGARSHLHAA